MGSVVLLVLIFLLVAVAMLFGVSVGAYMFALKLTDHMADSIAQAGATTKLREMEATITAMIKQSLLKRHGIEAVNVIYDITVDRVPDGEV